MSEHDEILALEILTMADLCEWLGTSVDTINRARRSGRFPKALRKIDRKPRWLKSEILRWLQRADLELTRRKAS